MTTHTVTFEPGEGSGTPFTQTVNAGEKLTLPSCSFTPPENKVFDKWDKGDPSEQIDVSGDMTVTALWKDATVTTYPVWVGEKQVDENNKDNILGDGTVSYTPGEGSGTLTFTTATPGITGTHNNALIYAGDINLTINGDIDVTNLGGSGLEAKKDITVNGNVTGDCYYRPLNSTGGSILVTGDVTVKSTGGTSSAVIVADQNVEIQGSAKITPSEINSSLISASNGSITLKKDIDVTNLGGSGLEAKKDITVNGNVTGDCYYQALISDAGSILVTGDVTVKEIGGTTGAVLLAYKDITIGGDVQLTGSYAYGLYSSTASIEVSGSVTGKAGDSVMWAYKNVTVGGDVDLEHTVDGGNYPIYAGFGEVKITGKATIDASGKSSYAVFASKDITIGGDATVTGSVVYGLYSSAGKVTMQSGKWDIDAEKVAIAAKEGITYPTDTHAITLPENGEINETTETIYEEYTITYYTVTEEDGTTVAKHAIIEPMEALTYTVTFDANGGSGTMDDATVTEGEKLTLPECTFTAPTEDQEFDTWDAGMPGDEIDVTADMTVKAQWKDKEVTPPAPATYTVTFDANGHGTAPEAQTVEEGETATEPGKPTASGYTFGGWYTDSACKTKYDFSTPVTEDITLYAKWTKKSSGGSGGGGYVSTYAITVEDAKNGDVTVSHKSTYKGATVTVTVDPDKGYSLETLTVTDKNGKEIELNNKGDGKYTFKMPGSKVTVKATFMDDNTMLNFFVDVPADAYYYDAVLWAVKEGITNGTSATTFSPDNPCTRAQMATFLWRAAGSPEPVGKTCIFTDVPADAYYAKAVQWAYEQKITNGTSATTFSPDETCTRAQMATFLCRVADGEPVSDSVIFNDVKADKYYAKSVQWAYEQKITVGTSATTFSPDDPCTRAQMVTFLYRYFVK